MRKKIEWNKVTWYSKILAGSIFVLLPLIAFYAGLKLGFFMGATPPQINIFVSGASDAYKTYVNKDLGFSLEYPSRWAVSEFSDQYTLATIERGDGQDAVKVYLQKNSYKDIYALKAAMDKRIGSPEESVIRHTKNFDALLYENIKGSAVMYVPITKDMVLGITGPDNSATLNIFNSFARL